MTPTDVLDRPAWQFWMDAQIRAAGRSFEADVREAGQQDGKAGTATEGEKQDVVDDQEQRADQREQMDGQPSIQDQLAALDDGGDGSMPSSGGG